MKFKTKIKKHFDEVLKIKTSPHSIAAGIAVGAFISILPTPGFNILISLLIVMIFKKINKIALFISLAFWNPLTVSPLYWLSYKIGNALFGTLPVIKYNIIILDGIYNFSRRFLIGNLLIASIISTTLYFLTYFIIRKNRKASKKL